MKKALIAFVVLASGALAATSALAQQTPKYTQYMFNRMALNPAAAGHKGVVSALGLYRYQWVGFGDGPRTIVANVHAPIDRINSGIGLGIVSDQLGTETGLSVNLNYAYRFVVGPGTLSVGVAGGVIQKSVDGTKLNPRELGDNVIPTDKRTATPLDLGAGIYYQSDAFYAGISSMQLNEAKADYGSPVSYNFKRHYMITGGTSFAITQGIKLMPNALVKSDLTKTQLDVNANVMFADKFWGGLNYSTQGDVALLLGAYPFGDDQNTPRLGIGYSYGYTTSNLAGTNSGIHEIMVHYDFPIHIKKKPKVIIDHPVFL